MPTRTRKPTASRAKPVTFTGSADLHAMVERVAPDVLALLADNTPRAKPAIVAALAGRHDADDVGLTLVRLAVTGRVVETNGRYTPAPPEAAWALGELVGRVERLEVRGRRCGRHGRLRLARLIAEHGAGTGLPDLAVRLAAGCPRAAAPDPAGRCFAYFPQLLEPPHGPVPGDAGAGQGRG